MPRTATDDEWEDDEWNDGEDWVPDEEEFEPTDDELPTISCPACGREMLEESIRCPYCGDYRSDEDAPSNPKPTWIIVGLILCFVAVYFWLVN